MSRIPFTYAAVVTCLLVMPGLVFAQARTPRAPAAPAGGAAAQPEWLGAPDRQDPSPTIVAKKGIGTANAMAEARMTPQELASHCEENGHLYPSRQDCVKQMTDRFGAKVFRATADCTAGRITTTAERAYTLDGLWDATDIGAGRTRWRDADGTIVNRDLINNGLHIAQQWEVLCPAPVTAAYIAKVKAAASVNAAAQARSAPPAQNPPLCGGEPLCTEVNSFAATITDFRASLNQPRKVLTITVRFENKSNRPLILGYVPGSGAAMDERGNRYGSYDPDVRGIGLIGRTVDAKFVMPPGQRGDARFTYYWDAGRSVFGTTFDVELVVREIVDLGNNQVELGAEHPLRVTGLVNGARPGMQTTAAPAAASPAAPAPATAPAPAAAAAAAAAPVPPQVDRCEAMEEHCYDAGPFTAVVTDVTGTVVGGRHHSLRLTLEITNHSGQPLILAYKGSTSGATDDKGNAYYWGRAGTHDTSVQGIGLLTRGQVDTQFALAPNQSRNATFTVTRFNSGAKPTGIAFTFDTVLAEVRVLSNGQQSETVREHSVHLPDLLLGRAGTSLEEAGKALRGLFRKKPKP